jgi:tetratricopeptide (TPR) repeat protein
VVHSQWAGWRAHAHLLVGRVDEARRLADEALRLGRQRGERGYQAWTLHVLGETEARCGPDGAPAAQGWYQQALALATELGMRPLVAHCHLGLARLYRRTGKAEQAHEHLTATAMYREMDMRLWLEQAEGELRALA